MTLQDIIYEIRNTAKMYNNDCNITDDDLAQRINNYREHFLSLLGPEVIIDQNLWQTIEEESSLTSGSEIFGAISSIALLKFFLPQTVNNPFEKTVKLYSLSGNIMPQEIDNEILFFQMINTGMNDNCPIFIKRGSNLLVYPQTFNGFVRAILCNPLEAKTRTRIVNPQSYSSDNLQYIGDGINLRERTMLDDYPINGQIKSMVVAKILTFDLNINLAISADEESDGTDTRKQKAQFKEQS